MANPLYWKGVWVSNTNELCIPVLESLASGLPFFLEVNGYYQIQRMVITSSKSSRIGPWGETAILSDDAQRLPLALEFRSVKT